MTTELDSSTGTELAASLIDVSKSYKHFKLRKIIIFRCSAVRLQA